jgi:hypothetical protein
VRLLRRGTTSGRAAISQGWPEQLQTQLWKGGRAESARHLPATAGMLPLPLAPLCRTVSKSQDSKGVSGLHPVRFRNLGRTRRSRFCCPLARVLVGCAELCGAPVLAASGPGCDAVCERTKCRSGGSLNTRILPRAEGIHKANLRVLQATISIIIIRLHDARPGFYRAAATGARTGRKSDSRLTAV